MVSQQSAFRPNLALACRRKGDSVRADLQPLLGQLRGEGGKGGKGGKGGSVGPRAIYCVCTAYNMHHAYSTMQLPYGTMHIAGGLDGGLLPD